MSKKLNSESRVKNFIKDLKYLHRLPVQTQYQNLVLSDYPFDLQLLTASPLYRKSRELYVKQGGKFSPRVCSTLRSLSALDLFKNEIHFSPIADELIWFKDQFHEVSDPEQEMEGLLRFNEISLFHEQNHRIIWRWLPPPPNDLEDLSRYLNFAESLVVVLDLALGDELGKKHSAVFERLKVIYRGAGRLDLSNISKEEKRSYWLAIFTATYFILEFINTEDILGAVDYILPNQMSLNKKAVSRSLEISELFTRITNPLWQERYAETAQVKLQKIHEKTKEPQFVLPEDPLELREDLHVVHRILDGFNL